jgi:hypothetical protein
MGRAYSGCGDAMEWNDIRSILPDESAAFEAQLEAAGVSMDDFCCAMAPDDMNQLDVATQGRDTARQTTDRIMAAWKDLAESFVRATTVEGAGLELDPGFHDPEDGDYYDEEPYGFFHVSGVYQLSPAGRKYADKIRH